jgi:hypothetical protein
MSHESGIQKADPAARARLLRWLVPFAGVGLLLAGALTLSADRLVAQAPLQFVLGLLGLLLLIGIVMLWPLRTLWRTGQSAMKARRFPPPGEPVVRDTPIRRGEEAVLSGRILQNLAVALALFVLLTPLALGWLLYLLIR